MFRSWPICYDGLGLPCASSVCPQGFVLLPLAMACYAPGATHCVSLFPNVQVGRRLFFSAFVVALRLRRMQVLPCKMLRVDLFAIHPSSCSTAEITGPPCGHRCLHFLWLFFMPFNAPRLCPSHKATTSNGAPSGPPQRTRPATRDWGPPQLSHPPPEKNGS